MWYPPQPTVRPADYVETVVRANTLPPPKPKQHLTSPCAHVLAQLTFEVHVTILALDWNGSDSQSQQEGRRASDIFPRHFSPDEKIDGCLLQAVCGMVSKGAEGERDRAPAAAEATAGAAAAAEV